MSRDRAIVEAEAARIADETGVPVARILIPTKGSRAESAARRRLYVALRDRGWSLQRIGQGVGRDHSSVAHGIEVARRES